MCLPSLPIVFECLPSSLSLNTPVCLNLPYLYIPSCLSVLGYLALLTCKCLAICLCPFSDQQVIWLTNTFIHHWECIYPANLLPNLIYRILQGVYRVGIHIMTAKSDPLTYYSWVTHFSSVSLLNLHIHNSEHVTIVLALTSRLPRLTHSPTPLTNSFLAPACVKFAYT